MTNKRILIFNVNWLGDVLFSTATIRNIRYNFPGSFITCIVPSRCYPILKNNPHIDELLIFDENDRHKSIRAKIKFIKFLKRKNFDLVFLLHRSFTRTLITRLAGIPERIGYDTKKRGFLLTQKIMPLEVNSLHRIDYYLNIIEKAGLRIEDRHPEFFVTDKDQAAVEDFLKEQMIATEDFLVGINPGGNWKPKRWPEEYWARLADELIKRFAAKVIITGSPRDALLAKEITQLMKGKPLLACGIFNLKQFAALCKRMDLFITADTGPLHIANALKTKKIIALFGPTSPKITGPYPDTNVIVLQKDVGCKIPCYVVKCKDNRCMKAITPEEVLAYVLR